MKVLAVTHDAGDYGAATSLANLIRNCEGVQFDVVIPKDRETNKNPDEFYLNKFGCTSGTLFRSNIYCDWLCYIGCCSENKKYVENKKIIEKFIYHCRSEINASKSKIIINKIINNNNYDLIHFNSLVLYRNIISSIPSVVHIREIYNNFNINILKKCLFKAKGLIFIDNATKSAIGKLYGGNVAVINNPVDMRNVGLVRSADICFDFDYLNNVIFSYIGALTEGKGVDFIIKSFLRTNRCNSVLVIAGTGKPEYVDYCREIASESKNIFFVGHCENVEKLYRITDYVVRGDDRQCVGRTVFEGLFSGCCVIAPGEKLYDEFNNDISGHSEKVYLYTPRSSSSLSELFNILSNKKVDNREYFSNVKNHVHDIIKFYQKVIR